MSDLFLLTRPRTATEGRLYRARVEIFFGNARRNVTTALIGGTMVAVVLWQYGAERGLLAGWTVLFLLSIGLLYLTMAGYRERMSLSALARLVPRRIAAGLLTAAFYGASPFLLPDGAPESAVIIISLILLVLFCIALLTYHVVPVFYVLIDIVVLGPLVAYLLFFAGTTNPLFIAIVVVGQLVLLPKGFQISRVALDRLRLNARLTTEIERHRRARKKIKHLALHDALTGVANRRLFHELWGRSAKLALREGKRLGLMFVDLDDFKPVNDRFGHEAGDQVLKTVAERLQGGVREVDLVCRYGGDEFFILLENIASFEALCLLAEKLARRLAEPIPIAQGTVAVTASIGCAVFPDDGRTLDEVTRTADRRMYEAKASHKGKAGAAAEAAASIEL